MAIETDKHGRNASKCDSRGLTTGLEQKFLHLARNRNKNLTKHGSISRNDTEKGSVRVPQVSNVKIHNAPYLSFAFHLLCQFVSTAFPLLCFG